MKRLTTLLAIFALLTGFAAANAHGNLDKGPGMVGAESPVYGLEVAFDNAAVSIGLKKAGDVAQERAAEAMDAQEKGDHESAERAANEMSKVAEKAKDRDLQGLAKAEAVLQDVMANAPEEAHQGLQTALSNVQQARERAQTRADNASGDEAGDAARQDGDRTQAPDDAMQGDNQAPDTAGTGSAPDNPMDSGTNQ